MNGGDTGTGTPGSHDEGTCPFCKEDKPNDLENDLDNNADTLRTNCNAADTLGEPEPWTSAPKSKEWCVLYEHPTSGKEEISEVRSNPHHCIPGNASLNGKYQSPLLEFITTEKGTIEANIGYDVNKRENGIWLPTILEDFFAGAGNPTTAGIRWGQLTKDYPNEQFTMAEAAMYEARRQFHDAHDAYSGNVQERLEVLHDRVKAKKIKCPDAAPKSKPNVPPPFSLVDWMDGLSRWLAKKLDGDPKRWKDPMFTSRHAEAFKTKLENASN